MNGRSPLVSTLLRYGGALALVAVAAGLSWLAPALSAAAPFTLFVLACLISARVFGLGAGIVTTLTGAIAGYLLFVPPRDLGLRDPTVGLAVVAYLVLGFVACWATASLRLARERMIRVLDSMSEGFTVADRGGRLLYANRRATELAGRPAAELEGRDAFEAFPALATGPAREEVRRALDSGRPTRMEVYVPGEERWFESRVVPTPQGFGAFTRDVTEHKLSQRRLGATLAALARSNQALEMFARGVSHELVQPLGAMMIFAQLMREETEGAAQQHAVRIGEIGERMSGLLKQYLHEARLVGDPGAREKVALDDLLAIVVRDLASALTGSGSTVVGAGLPVVEGDPALLRQLVHCLVQGVLLDGHASRLRLSARRDDDQAMVFALDVDPRAGVDHAGADPLAEQDDLALARRIIELHSGKVWTEPVAAGLAIRFTLPLARPTVPSNAPAVAASG